MASFTEGRHTGEHVLSEANGNRSREQGVLAAGDLEAGTVLAVDGSGDYVQMDPVAVDGTEVAVAVLYANVDASVAPQDCVVHARDCEVAEAELIFDAGITGPQTTTALGQLRSVGIIPR